MFLQEHYVEIAVMFLQEHFPPRHRPKAASPLTPRTDECVRPYVSRRLPDPTASLGYNGL
jgi:hypothetical protein